MIKSPGMTDSVRPSNGCDIRNTPFKFILKCQSLTSSLRVCLNHTACHVSYLQSISGFPPVSVPFTDQQRLRLGNPFPLQDSPAVSINRLQPPKFSFELWPTKFKLL